MGIGEPLDNYDNVVRFLTLISDPRGREQSLRHVSLSTCGIVPRIKQLMELKLGITLSVSLHSPDNAHRSSIMPVNRRWDINELIDACREYTELTGRRITFEYAVIDGVNDSAACARELASGLRGWLTHVNLIPLNEVKGREYKTANGRSVAAFKQILESSGVAVTVRRTLGSDIDAACGQLRRKKQCD